jgi:hypothetical protein
MLFLLAQTVPPGSPSWLVYIGATIGVLAVVLPAWGGLALSALAWIRANAIPEIKADLAAFKGAFSTTASDAAVAKSTAVAADATANQAVASAAAAHTTAAVAVAGVNAINATANAAGPAPVPTVTH